MTDHRKSPKPTKGKGREGVDGRAAAERRQKEQQRVLNRHRRQLHALAGKVGDVLSGEAVNTAQDAAALVRTIAQLHEMERLAHGIEGEKAKAPAVIFLPATAGQMEDWQAGATAAGLGTGPAAGTEAVTERPLEDDIQGDSDDWGDE